MLLLLLAAVPLAGACASRAGASATQGALEELRTPPPEGSPRIAERLGRYTAEGALAELSSPEGLERISSVVDTTVTRSLEAALRSPRVQGRGRGGGPAGSLVDRLARDSVAAFSFELQRALGPDGRGPLAASVGASVEQVSGAAVRGARSELGELFPGCEGEDRRACVEDGVRSLGRAAAAGFLEGVVGSAAWPALALAFVLGIALAVIAHGAWALSRALSRRRHDESEHRQAHP